MIEIVKATVDHKPEFAALAKEMHGNSPHKDLHFDHDKVAALIDYSLLEDPIYYVSVAVDEEGFCQGFFAGICMPTYYGNDKEAFDVGLYVRKQFRGFLLTCDLIKGFENWASSMGAKTCTIGSVSGIADERYMKFLNRLRYKNVGFITKKHLGGY